MTSRIHLRSTGLLVFGSRLVSVVTGLGFLVMVARWLEPSKFGLWEFILDLVTFSSYPVSVLSFWVTRDVARQRMVGKTAIFVAMAMSGGGIAIYLILGMLTYSRVATSMAPFLLAILLVPASYWNQISSSIVAGYRPAAAGSSLLVSEVCKLLSAYPLLFVFKAGISGVIVALLVAYLAQSVVATYATRGASAGDLRLSEARRWLGAAWLPAMSILPYFVGIADTFVASLAFGTALTGYYQAAFSVASIVGYSFYLSSALYPSLLAGGREELTSVTMDLSMLFGIPMAVGAAVLAPSILFLFAPGYVVGSLGLVILSFSLLFTTVSLILDQTLMGREKVDLETGGGRGRYIRSDLFFVATVNLVYSVGYNVLMYLSVLFANSIGLSTSYTVAAWAGAQLAATLAIAGVKAAKTRRSVKFFPARRVGRYAVTALPMGVLLYFLSGFLLLTDLDTLAFGFRLLGVVAVGAGFYFGALFATDGKFRSMALLLLTRSA